MRKSSQVPATLVATMAAVSLTGCSSSSKRCLDQAGKIIPDAECTSPSGRYTYPHWVYIPRSSGSGSGYWGWGSSSSGSSRGGFGSTGSFGS